MSTSDTMYSWSETDDFVYVRLDNALVAETWATVEPIVSEIIVKSQKARSHVTLLDLSILSTTGSAVVAAIVRIWRELDADGRKVILLAPSAETQATLKTAGLFKRLVILRDFAAVWDHLGLSRGARTTRRETSVLKWTAPTAAITAVLTLAVVLNSVIPFAWQSSVLFTLFVCGLLAVGSGVVAAARESGYFRHVARLTVATGLVTLVAATGHFARLDAAESHSQDRTQLAWFSTDQLRAGSPFELSGWQ